MALLEAISCLGAAGTAGTRQAVSLQVSRGGRNARLNVSSKQSGLGTWRVSAGIDSSRRKVSGIVVSAGIRESGTRFWKARFREDARRCTRIRASQPPSDVIIPTIVDDEEEENEDGESEEEARLRNWTERGWAPWEELLTPEAQFAVDSLADGEEEAAVSWEAFKKLNPKMETDRRQKEADDAAKKDRDEQKKEVKFEETMWNQPFVFRLTPPRDWPPPGWQVDAKELAYIRESFSLENHIIKPEDLDEENVVQEGDPHVPRWEMFLKQYNEWVEANKDALEEEAIEMDHEYYPGRRKTGDDYEDGMYELPFIYPGQHYWGVVTSIHLYEGAFVYFGGVHDGWVPIMDNDWYEIRKHIRVGMSVQVEVVAKRDPYRFRFPVEMRFVDPNIDDLIFRRFEYPPIFGRKGDDNLDEVAREAGRPYFPKLRPEVDPDEDEEDVNLAPVHPFVSRVWQIHEAEQMTLDDEEGIDDDDGQEYEEWAVEDDDPEGEWATEPGILHESDEDFEVPTIVLHIEDKFMNLEDARAERQALKVLAMEAEARGEEFVQPESRFDRRVKQLNDMHQERWDQEREALIRDRACRLQAGLPLEEPGRYADKSFWGKNPYDPREPQWRHDYWGDPEKLKEEFRKDREPRVRSVDEAVVEEDEDDLLDVIAGDATILAEEGVDGDDEGFVNQIGSPEGDQRVEYGDKEDRGAVNGTATKRIDAVREIFDVEEGDWNFVEDSEGEGDKAPGDENTTK
ncbi:hypothetical protein MPTK1_4g08250 [Marchantia polymorpha subsp. ruderalis]|uniref:S1 motif domain-containing protein n=2 Tax=Marchantia polymorpha TaxID=3197 RepID=A0A176VSC3_MARPO|nr:hypothetical protein AXG93_2997s1190 [Marchantia polymorpha subsp. ruderalis]PTQ30745.1 hypothetical protein MARPO_0120s0021 [Marchantia polymorpha]BBN08027.1 hypothetical protein Mp_4g08250 [Marchantia polymorpha subsp. ruderalis]|eukprot:PTQ30745.1 hypothetical protein MARPO_0120s0021 [Marchantia polymorpha]